MTFLKITLRLLLLLAGGVGYAQDMGHFYYVQDTDSPYSCNLPPLYFLPGENLIELDCLEDIRYIATQMRAHPDMRLRIEADGLYERFDREQKRLNRLRVRQVLRELVYVYKIDHHRILAIEHKPWEYIRRGDTPADALTARRILCSCYWLPHAKPAPLPEAEAPFSLNRGQ
ncbi:MAG: hypothetical protein SF053_07100 [Bacteroidia bacterium]|nr:hypothetical protein [Bacteroidia bacterium]